MSDITEPDGGLLLLRGRASVTRFDEIFPIRQRKSSLWQFSQGKNFNQLALIYMHWANFQCCKSANIENNNLAIWSHWGGPTYIGDPTRMGAGTLKRKLTSGTV